jgi:Icc-related predicted phosphoesterase
MQINIQTENDIKRIEALADTHGKHRQLSIPVDTDILVFAGDACDAGDEMQLQDFFAWFAQQSAKYKLFVPGNHDLPFELDPEYAVKSIPKGITFIENGGVTFDGIRFYILPVRPWMHRSLDLPYRVDVLVTHGAPLGILDDNGRWGCPILRELVDDALPRIHIFGHCHQCGTQQITIGKTLFCNTAINTDENENE